MAVRREPGRPLTAREREVTALVAGGLTSKQIAARLPVCPDGRCSPVGGLRQDADRYADAPRGVVAAAGRPVNERQALELEGALSQRYPGGEVTVTPQDDGARVVIEIGGESCVLSVGDVPSVLLGYLLTGYAD